MAAVAQAVKWLEEAERATTGEHIVATHQRARPARRAITTLRRTAETEG